jgi:hypothetical protein
MKYMTDITDSAEKQPSNSSVENKIPIQFSLSRKDVIAGFRFSFFIKFVVPVFVAVTIIFFINLITGAILYALLMPPLIFMYFITGKKQYSKNRIYQEEHFINIVPKGIELCDSKWRITETLFWSAFSKATWNKKVIVFFRKESKARIIIPVTAMSEDKLKMILGILESVYKSKTYFN